MAGIYERITGQGETTAPRGREAGGAYLHGSDA